MPISKQKAEAEYEKILRHIEDKYGNKETNNVQLDKIGHKLFNNKFKGVYAADTIPVLPEDSYAIVNLDESNKPGSHWVAVVKHNDHSYIYDSFGRKTFKILPSIIQSGNGLVEMTENDAEQDDLEENCGQRSLAALCIYNRYGWDGLKHI